MTRWLCDHEQILEKIKFPSYAQDEIDKLTFPTTFSAFNITHYNGYR